MGLDCIAIRLCWIGLRLLGLGEIGFGLFELCWIWLGWLGLHWVGFDINWLGVIVLSCSNNKNAILRIWGERICSLTSICHAFLQFVTR